MKVTFYFFSIITVVLLYSCNEDIQPLSVVNQPEDTTYYAYKIDEPNFFNLINFEDNVYRELWDLPLVYSGDSYTLDSGTLIATKGANCTESTSNSSNCNNNYYSQLDTTRPNGYMLYHAPFSKEPSNLKIECSYLGPNRMRLIVASSAQSTQIIPWESFIASFGQIDTKMEALLIVMSEGLLEARFRISDPLKTIPNVQRITKKNGFYEIVIVYSSVRNDSFRNCFDRRHKRVVHVFTDQSHKVISNDLIFESEPRVCTTCD